LKVAIADNSHAQKSKYMIIAKLRIGRPHEGEDTEGENSLNVIRLKERSDLSEKAATHAKGTEKQSKEETQQVSSSYEYDTDEEESIPPEKETEIALTPKITNERKKIPVLKSAKLKKETSPPEAEAIKAGSVQHKGGEEPEFRYMYFTNIPTSVNQTRRSREEGLPQR
jgi:hypothetical protein